VDRLRILTLPGAVESFANIIEVSTDTAGLVAAGVFRIPRSFTGGIKLLATAVAD